MFKRLIISFTILFIFISIYFAYTSITFTSEILDDLETKNAKRLVYIVLDKNSLLDDKALIKLKSILGGEVFLYNKEGEILISTLKKGIPEELKKLTHEEIKQLSTGPIIKKLQLHGMKYRFIIFKANLSPEISTYFGLLLPAITEEKIQRSLITGLIYTSFAGLMFMLVVSWLLSRSITQPLEDLVENTKQIGKGNWSIKIKEKGPPEVKTLARALNEMSKEVRDYQQRLIEAERLSTAAQLVASIAHEIKNPLTSLKLAAEILTELTKDNQILEKRAELVLKETIRLEKILQNMLSRTKKIEIVRKIIDVNQIITEVVEVAKTQFQAKKQKLELKLSNEPLKIAADPEKIKQVLWNLLNNACEATPEKGKITIKTLSQNGNVEIWIEDSGPGIPEEKIKDLFRPFYSTKPNGTGLGLAVSKQIVLFHGGELLLENKEGGGARARIVLPRLKESQDSNDKPS
ncbi:sensor histidine kinase [Thermodesulfatator atlanticus]|uniref:sensor histidine kinase n=1 Tax=Thermodesulfatator atlanticus TaxID=501497 RepID=UPI0003B7B855|nr:HAMP domain-containing sensor histidine kinase [Thermodesulfatator atlanticus]